MRQRRGDGHSPSFYYYFTNDTFLYTRQLTIIAIKVNNYVLTGNKVQLNFTEMNSSYFIFRTKRWEIKAPYPQYLIWFLFCHILIPQTVNTKINIKIPSTRCLAFAYISLHFYIIVFIADKCRYFIKLNKVVVSFTKFVTKHVNDSTFPRCSKVKKVFFFLSLEGYSVFTTGKRWTLHAANRQRSFVIFFPLFHWSGK